MFYTHFASKNQLPDFYIDGALVENGLNSLMKYFRVVTRVLLEGCFLLNVFSRLKD